ncbi:MAG TPA: hypothetical protein VKB78_12775 [Pirellulales bacterium]|nr:hypothetical protein [Pirellulales bacterium]
MARMLSRMLIAMAILVSLQGIAWAGSAGQQEKPATEFKAVVFPPDEAASTKLLNDLAADGWQYVGPLGNSLVAFKRVRGPAAAADAETPWSRWQGAWVGDGGQEMLISGDRWTMSTPGWGPVSGTLKLVEDNKEFASIDLVVEEGPTQGQICKAIFRFDDGVLRYSGNYGDRPTDLIKQPPHGACITWRPAKSK